MTYCMDEYMNGVSFGDISCDQNPSSFQNFISEIFLPYPHSAADDDHGDRSGLSLWKRLD